MRALLWDGSRARFVSDAPIPSRLESTAVVRVRLAGICSTDLQILSGYMGFRGILGHEFVGEVVDGPPGLTGRRVVGEINFACHRCATCDAGRPRHCPNRTVLGILGADGAFAEFVRIPTRNLHQVSDGVTDEEAVFVEPLAAAFQASRQTSHLTGARSAVLGAGKLGLLVAQVLALRGDRVTLVCRTPATLARVRERFDLAATLVDDAPAGWDLVVEATGSPDGLALALRLVRPLGSVVLKSTVVARHDLDLAPAVIDEVTVIGSRCGEFQPALEALATGQVKVRALVEETFRLGDAQPALERAAGTGALKGRTTGK